MKQFNLNLKLDIKKTRKREFLAQMEKVVPWDDLVALIAPYYPEGKNGRPPFSLHSMLRIHFLQQWFSLSDPAMEEAFFGTPLYREFAQLEALSRLPDESTILRFRHRLEQHKLAEKILGVVNDLLSQRGLLLKAGTVVDATLIPAPTSTKNKDKARDPEMHSSKKGHQWHFGMKAHIGADAESGLVHSVRTTSGNVHDVTEGNSLLHGEETVAFGDAGYQGVDNRPDAKASVAWQIAMGTGKRRTLDKANQADALIDQAEKLKAGIRSKVEHLFRVIKRQFGFVKVRYKGLKKNAAQLMTLFALSNLWMVRGQNVAEQVSEVTEITMSNCQIPPSENVSGLNHLAMSYSDHPYFSIVQRKVLTPNDFPCLAAIAQRLADFERYFESMARPFEWKFTRADLNALIARMRNRWSQSNLDKMPA